MNRKSTATAAPEKTPQRSHGTRQSGGRASQLVFKNPFSSLQQSLGNQAMLRLFEAGVILTKLRISRPGDADEKEADRVADQVMCMPEHMTTIKSESHKVSKIYRKCSSGESCSMEQSNQNGRLQPKMASTPSAQVEAPPVVRKALPSSGQPLDASTRAFMEARFGQDLSGVRLHTDAGAAELARSVNARAFTSGRDVVFGPGTYEPGTDTGKRLLAHELAHVIQQQSGRVTQAIQRAEVDDRSCAGLKDIEAAIDQAVNQVVDDERKSMGKPVFGPLLSLRVAKKLGGQTPVSPIEEFVESLPATKRNLPPSDLAGTKYSGVSAINKFYGLQSAGVHVVGSAAKIHGICVGADKLGHFFDQGFQYRQEIEEKGTKADTENLGKTMEAGVFGLKTTGVFSNADLAANRAGLKFYRDLEKHPSDFKFKIQNYVTPQWNEQTNPSFYEEKVGAVVWSNLLTGTWEGTFTPRRGHAPSVKSSFNFAFAAGKLTGTFVLHVTIGPGRPSEATIKNATVVQRKKAISMSTPSGPETVEAVSGITIEFGWEWGKDSGKGHLESKDEQHLTGTLGSGISSASSGSLNLTKQ